MKNPWTKKKIKSLMGCYTMMTDELLTNILEEHASIFRVRQSRKSGCQPSVLSWLPTSPHPGPVSSQGSEMMTICWDWESRRGQVASMLGPGSPQAVAARGSTPSIPLGQVKLKSIFCETCLKIKQTG
jgi:hypothetical protein